MSERVPAVVIGGGSAGLATSYHLKRHGVEHVVIERARVGDAWASKRWDSFTLVTPNWTFLLPGMPYDGDDPDGYLRRDAIVARLEEYARRFALPVRTGADVTRLRPSGDGWELTVDGSRLEAGNVVVATGAFPEPRVLPASASLSPRVVQLHTSEYRNPAGVPEGGVLIVGSGQSGVQIAEELLGVGRPVSMCVGTCPRMPRRYRGQDFVRWFEDSGYFDVTLGALPSPSLRLACNPQATGRDGGHDLDVWRLARRGLVLLGRFVSARGEHVELADTLTQSLAASEERTRKLLSGIDDYIARARPRAPAADPADLDFSVPAQQARTHIDLHALGISTVIWATGFRPAYPWIEGAAFDADGFPVTQGGITGSPGLYFVGLHVLHNRKSGILLGVGADAERVADHVAGRLARA